ncbi:MAG: pilus (MSHA type) biogenesis protein MshL [Desulfobacterales bacterium]|nr:MAG: pilus (MSHA type) biogenesis protein MshL [Desulfobacterales bacterium]
MRNRIIIPLMFFFLSVLFLGCRHTQPVDSVKPPSPLGQIVTDNSRQLAEQQRQRVNSIEKKQPKIPMPMPVMPVYDPLEDQLMSLSMTHENLETILYLIADTVGMNLIIDGSVNAGAHKVTLNFQNVSAKMILKTVTEQFDLNYEVIQNVIRVRSLMEKVFPLNFLDTNVSMAFDVGGDVLGGGNDVQASGLAGSVTLKGNGAKKGNPYEILKEMVAQVKTKEGIVTVNPLSGSLYIKDKPSVVKTVAQLLNQFKEMLSRQILIEARIIEVTLSSGYEYGIDWRLLRAADNNVTTTKLKQLSWNLTDGLVLTGFNDTFNFGTVVSALETFGDVKIVSNPTIRAKHGKPAVISVGDSIAYKKSVETTQARTGTETTETTEVEVSTVFDGLILGVIPFIEPNGKINLLINPIKSDVDIQSIENSEVVADGLTISLPKVSIKEISTSITLNDRDVVVLGGLISDEQFKEDKNVPLLGNIPLLGHMFKNEYTSEKKKELVIILNVSIL